MTFFRKMIEKTKKYATLPKSEKTKKIIIEGKNTSCPPEFYSVRLQQ